MNQVDVIIIGVSLIFWVIFAALWMGKMYKSYLWILLGFLFCLLINLKLNFVVSTNGPSDIIEVFLSKHRVFFAWLSIICIPLFWALLTVNNSISFKSPASSLLNMFGWFIGGAILLPFLLGLFYVINNLWLTTSRILASIIDMLKSSNYWEFLPAYEYLIFLLIFWILFYKFILYYFFLLIRHFMYRMSKLREEEKRYRKSRSEEEDDHDDEVEEGDEKPPLH